MLRITMYNQKSTLTGDTIVVHKLRESYRLRIKNSFFNPLVRAGRWDGYVRYISETNGLFSTGLLHDIIEILDNCGEEYEIMDKREPFKPVGCPDILPNGDKLRDDQRAVVEAVLNHRIKGIRFTRGMVDAATNFGKSYVIAGLFQSYANKRTGVLLINSKVIFDQLVRDLERIMPGEVGEISTRKINIKRFTVCMVQTVHARINKDPAIKRFLNNCDICLVDEADLSSSTAHKTCFKECANAPVRIGLTGTAQDSKDKVKNREILSFFGPIITRTTNAQLIESGVSTVPKVSIFCGNLKDRDLKYREDYTASIVKNRQRNKKVWHRVEKNLTRKRFPLLIMCKIKEHSAHLLKVIPSYIRDIYRVESVFHDTPNAMGIIQEFAEGKIDVLIAGFFLKRGKNMPMIKCLINAASGDSQTNVKQIVGRALRKHETKDKVYIEDFYDYHGVNIRRHGKHRINYYKAEGFEVVEYWKKRTIKK